MYRLKEIQDKLLPLIGWEQPYNPSDKLEDNITSSESGLYYQGVHPLLTINNIKSVMPMDFIFRYPIWVDSIQYNPLDKVLNGNKVWKCLVVNTGIEPGSNNGYWIEYNYLSDFIENRTRNGIATMVQNFITKKKLSKETHSIIENKTLFDGAGRLDDVIYSSGKICGYEIVPIRSMGVTMKLNRVGFQMKGGTGTFKLYIFHSNNVNPYKIIDINLSGQNGYQWFDLNDVYLPYISNEKNSGGSWFVCYNQNELPEFVDAVNINRDFSKTPCTSCNRGNYDFWKELLQYAEVYPFKYTAPSDFEQYPEMWDIEKNVYTSNVNYGINLDITIGCDLTDFIISQRDIFTDVLQKQVAFNILREIAMNPDVNVSRNQVNTGRQELLYELDGNTQGRAGGLGNDLSISYKALSLDTKRLDRICLGCKNNGVRYISVSG